MSKVEAAGGGLPVTNEKYPKTRVLTLRLPPEEIAQSRGSGEEIEPAERKDPLPSNESLYFKEITGYPLLQTEEEVWLSRVIHQDVDPAEAVSNLLLRPKREKVWAGYLEDGTLSPLRAEEIMVKANLRLVIRIAKKWRRVGGSFSDLIQEGNMSLLRAAKNFDWRKGVKFSTYASWGIEKNIAQFSYNQGREVRLPIYLLNNLRFLTKLKQRFISDFGRLPTIEELIENEEVRGRFHLSEDLEEARRKLARIIVSSEESSFISLDNPNWYGREISLEELIPDENGPVTDQEALAVVSFENIRDLLSTVLTAREERIIILYYGLDGSEGMSLMQLGSRFGLTAERIRQIKLAALKKLNALPQFQRDQWRD